MLIAETSPEMGHYGPTYRDPTVMQGPLKSCYYREIIIVNYMGEDLYVVDLHGNVSIIETCNPAGLDDHVDVIIREYTGPRVWTGVDSSPNKRWIHRIPADVIRNGFVYSHTANVSLCVAPYNDSIDTAHPYSESKLAVYCREIEQTVRADQGSAPFTLIANDPTFTYDNLYTEINGRICEIEVTHRPPCMGMDNDTITVSYRAHNSGTKTALKEDRITFREIVKLYKDEIWTLGGCTFSPNKEKLEIYLDMLSKKKGITVDDPFYKRVRNEIEEAHELELERLRDANDALKKQNTQCKDALARALSGEYSERAIDLKFEELRYERDDLLNKVTILGLKSEAEEKSLIAKGREEVIKTVTSIFKAVAVVVPIVFGLFKWWKSRSA